MKERIVITREQCRDALSRLHHAGAIVYMDARPWITVSAILYNNDCYLTRDRLERIVMHHRTPDGYKRVLVK